MSSKTEMLDLYLTGPKEGKTVVLGRGMAKAVKGVIRVNSTDVNLIGVLKKFYAASETKPEAKK